MISRLLQPLLSLHGWEAYALVGLLVFAEDAVMLGFVFPGETAAILGGVLASKGGVSLGGIVAVVVLCAIVGDSVGYAIGDAGAASCCSSAPAQAPEGHRHRARPAGPARRDRRVRRPLLRLPARRRPGAGRHVQDALPHLPARQRRRGHLLGVLFVLLGYFVGQRVEKASGIASDVLLGLIVVVVVVLVVRHRRKEKREFEGPSEAATPGSDPGRLTDRGSGGRVEDGAVPGAQAGQDPGELPRRVVALGVGVHPAHRCGVAAVEPVEAEARLVGAPLVVVDQRPVQVGRAPGRPSATASATAPRCSRT